MIATRMIAKQTKTTPNNAQKHPKRAQKEPKTAQKQPKTDQNKKISKIKKDTFHSDKINTMKNAIRSIHRKSTESVESAECNESIESAKSAESKACIESVESIKKYATRIYSSQKRAVTTADFEALIPTLYAETESVSAFGGETLNPPQYGKTFVSIKPTNGPYLSDFNERKSIFI